MKYQQLEHQETNWKWMYLMKKIKDGVNITKYLEKSQIEIKTNLLIEVQGQAEKINDWVEKHLNPELEIKLSQALRAKRKRFYNSEQHSRKKSIDLNYTTWQRLARYSKRFNLTLSQTIDQVLDEYEFSRDYTKKVSQIRNELKNVLTKKDS